MGKHRKKNRRLRLKMTDAEAKRSKWNEPCPRASCGSKETYVVEFSFGGYYGCHDCGKEWGWHDARGTGVSRQKYEERAEADRNEWKAKAARSRRMDAPGEGTEMAKKKKLARRKGTKGAKKSAPKKADGARDPRIPKVGTVIKAKYKGKDYTAKVTADGFEFKGKEYKSISKVGSVIMSGKACNGYKLFGLCK